MQTYYQFFFGLYSDWLHVLKTLFGILFLIQWWGLFYSRQVSFIPNFFLVLSMSRVLVDFLCFLVCFGQCAEYFSHGGKKQLLIGCCLRLSDIWLLPVNVVLKLPQIVQNFFLKTLQNWGKVCKLCKHLTVMLRLSTVYVS